MEKINAYEVIIAKTTGETEKIIIKVKRKINERVKITEVISKLYERMDKKELDIEEWSIIKIEKINGVTEKEYVELLSENKIDGSITNITNSVKKLGVRNLSNEPYVINFFNYNDSLLVTLTSMDNIIKPRGTTSVFLRPGKHFNLIKSQGKVVAGSEEKINKIKIINKTSSDNSIYIGKSIIEDDNDDVLLLTIFDINDKFNGIDEVKFGEEKDIINMEK